MHEKVRKETNCSTRPAKKIFEPALFVLRSLADIDSAPPAAYKCLEYNLVFQASLKMAEYLLE